MLTTIMKAPIRDNKIYYTLLSSFELVRQTLNAVNMQGVEIKKVDS